MRTCSIGAVCLAAFLSASTLSASTLSAGAQSDLPGWVPCSGPFVACAIEVQAKCSIDPGGRLRMTYWDFPGYTVSFERCVGNIFERSGRPNPYKTGIASSGGLTVPYSEVLYPRARMRD